MLKLTPVFRYEGKTEEERNLVFKGTPTNKHINGASSRRFRDVIMVFDRFISQSKQSTLSPCFIFIPKTAMGLPKTRVCFQSEVCFKHSSVLKLIP